MKKIILIDGNSLMFRSFYATFYSGMLMKNSQGLVTNAIFGFVNMLAKLQKEEKSHIFVAFDAGKQTFRHQQYSDYKGTRKALPEELLMQIPYIKQYLDILKIKRYETLDFEADDIIATMARLAQKEGFEEIRIITGDKDLLQMVGGNIKVCITRKGATDLEEFNEDNFYEKMGLFPSQIPDYKGLVGDTSDNLPGIKGIGEKTAIKLLNEYQTLENILDNTASLKGKMKEIIENGQESGRECKRLATLETNVPFNFGIEDTIVKEYDVDELVHFYKELEFNSFINELDLTNNNKQNSVDKKEINYVIVDNNEDLFTDINHAYIACEVFGSNYYQGTFLGISLISDEKYFFITAHGVKVNQSLKTFLEDENKIKKTFDFKKLYVTLKQCQIEIKNVTYDMLLAAYLINPSYANEDIKNVANEFKINDLDYDDAIYGSKSKASIPDASVYMNHSLHKAILIRDLEDQLLNQLEKNDQMPLFSVEMGLSSVLGDMELDGLKVDKAKLEAVAKELSKTQDIIANQIYQIAGQTFNINSVKQLGEILFEKLGLPSGKKNKTGFSTNSDVLEKLAKDYEIAQLILDYRGIAKIISTYINGLFEVMNENCFIHPLYRQAFTSTGRLSSIEPNIQNMPIRTEQGQVIREAFISRFPGGKIMSSDYSQIELRVLAHIANDENMIKMFKDNVDFHTQTASQMYDVPVDEVTKDMRRAAKAINFGIIYGMSAWGLSESIKISPIDATKYIEKYFATFKDVKKYLDEVVATAKENGYTKTLFNRLRYLPELKSDNKALVAFGERTAMNSPIQGSAADIIKIAMINVKRKMKGLKSKMIAQVHDELVFDVAPDEIEIMQKIVKETMETATSLRVPLIVEVGYGENWFEA